METKQVVKERNQSEQVVETGDKNYEMHIGRNKPEIMTENEPLPDKVVWKEQGDKERGEERHVVEKEVAPTRGRLELEPTPDKVVWNEQVDRERGEERQVVESEVAPTRERSELEQVDEDMNEGGQEVKMIELSSKEEIRQAEEVVDEAVPEKGVKEAMKENGPTTDKVVWKEQMDMERGEKRQVVENEVAPPRGRFEIEQVDKDMNKGEQVVKKQRPEVSGGV